MVRSGEARERREGNNRIVDELIMWRNPGGFRHATGRIGRRQLWLVQVKAFEIQEDSDQQEQLAD
jgi:hypothetical protein